MHDLLPHLFTLGIGALGVYVWMRVRDAETRKDIQHLRDDLTKLEGEVKLLRERWHGMIQKVQQMINDLYRRSRNRDQDEQ